MTELTPKQIAGLHAVAALVEGGYSNSRIDAVRQEAQIDARQLRDWCIPRRVLAALGIQVTHE